MSAERVLPLWEVVKFDPGNEHGTSQVGVDAGKSSCENFPNISVVCAQCLSKWRLCKLDFAVGVKAASFDTFCANQIAPLKQMQMLLYLPDTLHCSRCLFQLFKASSLGFSFSPSLVQAFRILWMISLERQEDFLDSFRRSARRNQYCKKVEDIHPSLRWLLAETVALHDASCAVNSAHWQVLGHSCWASLQIFYQGNV